MKGVKLRRLGFGLPLLLAASGVLAQTVRIVALGDRTTATARDWAPEIQEVYADCLPRALAPLNVSATVINAGIGDTTTRQAVARLDRDVLRHHPDIVIVQFGINDSWIDVDEGRTRPRLSRAEFRANLRKHRPAHQAQRGVLWCS